MISVVPTKMLPDVGSSSPAIIRKVVVLPQPDGPRSAKNDPCGMTNERSSTALKSPYVLVRFFNIKSPFAEVDASTAIRRYQPPIEMQFGILSLLLLSVNGKSLTVNLSLQLGI